MADNKDVTTTVPLGMKPEDMLTAAGDAQANKEAIVDSIGQTQATGSGAQAATGTEYSWNQQGTNMANTQLQMDVNQAKQNALANRQTIEQNSQSYQQQADMMKYSANQSAQSAGWTGGYVLDQNRQMEYLKSSIQAQMYGAMELQKYGYDTSLAAARLSYDLNQQEFAHQYYMDAVNVAVIEAEQTGYYISAEARDMLSQFNIAQEKLNKDSTDEQAQAVVNGVKEWFKQNSSYIGEDGKGPDISDAAIKTLSTINMELSSAQSDLQMYMNAYFETLDRVQAADAAAAEKLKNDPNAVIIYDPETGEPKYNPATGIYEIAYLNTMTPQELVQYSKTSKQTEERIYSYLDGLLTESLNAYTKMLVDSKGNIITNATEEGVNKYLDSGKKAEVEAILKEAVKSGALANYSHTLDVADATVTFTVDSEGNLKTEFFSLNDNSEGGQANTGSGEAYNLVNTNGVGSYNWTYAGTGDDATITLNDTTYNLTVRWSNYADSTHNGVNVKDAAEKLNKLYPNAINGSVVFYENQYFVYYKDKDIWGIIVQGDDQDKKAGDAANFINAIKPIIQGQKANSK